jgi:PAS domain S-box-containing protein
MKDRSAGISPIFAFDGDRDLRALTNAMPALVSFYDADHICRFANDFHVDWYGREPATLVGRHMSDFIGPAHFAKRLPYLEEVAKGRPVSFDAQVPHRDGSLHDAAIRYMPRVGPDGYEGCYVMVFDIGRRQRELAEMLDEAHDAIFVRDLEGRITYWNRGCETLYGHTGLDALGQDADSLLGTRLPGEGDAHSLDLLVSGRWEGEVLRRLKDGSDAVVASRWSLRRDIDGKPVEILETGRDVTAAREAEEALKRSDFRYRNVFQAMAVAFWEVDFSRVGGMLQKLRSEGVVDFPRHLAETPGLVREMMARSRTIDVNEKTLQLFRGTREDFLGSVEPFWARSSEGVFAESILAVLAHKPHYEAEAKFRRLDGSEFDGLFTCCFPRESVAAGTILVGIVDITDRLRAQDEVARIQAELAHAARVSTLGELTASIAHEVNQPLAAIVTNGEAGLRWLNRAEPDLDETRAAVGRMIAEGQRASEIIARIRALATKGETERAPLDLAPLIEDAALLVRREVTSHDVRLMLRTAPGLPRVTADRVQLQQVLINLMVNAIQAMSRRQGGLRDLSVATVLEEEMVAIEVADTGPGIAPENMARLFDAFFTTRATGMGMGLSISKSIVEAHGGRISARPAEGGGTVFRFTLPVAE